MKYWWCIKTTIQILGTLGLFCLLSRCVDPINIDIPEQKQLLVVDGLITDKPGPYFVKLALSSNIDQLLPNPVSQAEVMIEEKGGEQVILSEINPGEYLTDSASFRGKVGNQYRLKVSLRPDQNYQSTWITLKASPPVEKVYYEFGFLPNEDILVQGAEIFLDTRDPENKTKFYRWEWEETWVDIAPFASGLIFDGTEEPMQGPVYNICYNSSQSEAIYLSTSINSTSDEVLKFPIHIVSGFGGQLRTKYSILVKQYALDEEEFLFWKRVQETNEDSGTLFDQQPQSTTGNIIRVENDREAVLGYFSVSGYSEKRLFISREELPETAVIGEQYIQNCIVKADTLPKGLASVGDVWDALSTGSVFFNFWRDPDIIGWILVTKDCADCRETGGTIEEPDFWE